MSSNRLWGAWSSVALLLTPILFTTACEDGDKLPGVKPPDAGPPKASAVAANGLVAGGTVMRSSRYRLVGSMSPGVADGSVGKSPGFVLRSGLVGASQ